MLYCKTLIFCKLIPGRLQKTAFLQNEFNFLVREYYLDTPKEKGKKRTEFYKEMSGIIDDFERTVFSMREKLNNPDSIQGYSTM